MITLEELFNSENDAEYAIAREKAVSQISDYLSSHLYAPFMADVQAEVSMSQAEEQGWIDGDKVSGEVPGRYTESGNPLPFTVAVDSAGN